MDILRCNPFPEYNPVCSSGFTDDVFPVSYIEDIGIVSPSSLQAVVPGSPVQDVISVASV